MIDYIVAQVILCVLHVIKNNTKLKESLYSKLLCSIYNTICVLRVIRNNTKLKESLYSKLLCSIYNTHARYV